MGICLTHQNGIEYQDLKNRGLHPQAWDGLVSKSFHGSGLTPFAHYHSLMILFLKGSLGLKMHVAYTREFQIRILHGSSRI